MATAARVEALVKPELLRWGRETASLSIGAAAKKVGVTPERLLSWENGDARPSIPQLRNIAEAYKRPLAAFYLPAPPAPLERPRDFRRPPGEGASQDSPALLYEMRRAVYRREVAMELLYELGEEPSTLAVTVSQDDDPEKVGAQIRNLLGVDYATQVAWKDDSGAFRFWRTSLERLGVLVFLARGIPLAEMYGFSISHWPLPVIEVNGKHQERARIFTMLHEFTHLLLHEGGICDSHESRAVEVFCNHVAGAALVPMDRLLQEERVKNAPDRSTFGDDDIVGLARRYNASREAILRRLLIAGRVTEPFYQSKRQQFQQEFDKTRSGGRALPHTKSLNTLGTLFPRLVLESYEDRRITASDLAEYLGLRLKHLPKLQEAMRPDAVREPIPS